MLCAMEEMWPSAAGSQFEVAIEMLGSALRECPEELWRERLWQDQTMPGFSEFWYVAYHTLFWLDLYLSGSREGFAPPAPFTLDELDPAGVLPPRVYTRDELERYLAHSAEKCRETFKNLTDEQARRVHQIGSRGRTIRFAELLLYNMGHVREHAAQLSMFLGQRRGLAST
ncbi:MAG: DinB family protein [Candidatus Dormiibacterota bacterium]